MPAHTSERISALAALDLAATEKTRLGEFGQHFCKKLGRLGFITSCAIYSSTWKESNLFALRNISDSELPFLTRQQLSEVGGIPIEIDFLKHNIIKNYALPDNRAPRCVLLMKCDPATPAPSLDELKIIERAFARGYATVLAATRTELRSLVLFHGEGRSLQAFVHECITQTMSFLQLCESAALFTQHRTMPHYLTTAATSHGLHFDGVESNEKLRQRTRIPINSRIAACMKTRMVETIELYPSHRPPSELDDRTSTLWNQISLPIQYQREHTRRAAAARTTAPYMSRDPVGLLRFSNFRMGSTLDQIPRPITWEDVYLLEFLSEIVFVLLRVYLAASKYEHEMERVLHGFKYLIGGAFGNLSIVDRALTRGTPKELPMAINERPGARLFTLPNVQHAIGDAVNFISDMEFQLDKTTKGLLRRKEVGVISNFHRDVLMVAVQNAQRSAQLYDRSELEINSLVKAGSFLASEVTGNKNAFVAVFRNLLENSLKYAGDAVEKVKVEISFFDFDNRFVDVHVRDFGLGLADEERGQIFHEGFRGVAAEVTGQTGAGIGLSYSRELMNMYGGELFLAKEPSGLNNGVCFIVRLRTK